jgi:predicted metalloendopeptidase
VTGFTNDQLLFIGYAQSWCTEITPEFMSMLINVDPHSPARFRVNGPLSNLPEFSQAFSCPVGTPMHPEQRCEVW